MFYSSGLPLQSQTRLEHEREITDNVTRLGPEAYARLESFGAFKLLNFERFRFLKLFNIERFSSLKLTRFKSCRVLNTITRFWAIQLSTMVKKIFQIGEFQGPTTLQFRNSIYIYRKGKTFAYEFDCKPENTNKKNSGRQIFQIIWFFFLFLIS